MKDTLLKPLVVAATSTAALLIIGTAMGWFTLESELLQAFAEAELSSKETAAYVVGLTSIIATLIAALLNKNKLTFISAVVGVYGAILVYNQLPSSEEQDILGIGVRPGYWIALSGAVLSTLINIFIAVKGFSSQESTTTLEAKDSE